MDDFNSKGRPPLHNEFITGGSQNNNRASGALSSVKLKGAKPSSSRTANGRTTNSRTASGRTTSERASNDRAAGSRQSYGRQGGYAQSRPQSQRRPDPYAAQKNVARERAPEPYAVTRSSSAKRPSGKARMPVWKMIIYDLLALGIAMCVFAYFHHINPIRSDPKPVDLPAPTADAPNSPQATPSPGDSSGSMHAAPVVPDESDGPSQSDKFTDGTPEITDNSYKGKNINVTVETHTVQNSRGDDVVYHTADIYVRDVKYLKTAFAGGEYGNHSAFLNDLASDHGAFVAISGDQYGGRMEGAVVRNGTLYRETPFEDVAVLTYSGELKTIPEAEFNIDEIKREGAWQVWAFGPMLLNQGQPMKSDEFNSSVRVANPRSSMGMIEPNHFVFIVVDGRQGGYSAGMTLEELSALYYELGCKTAYNFDGGDTASMAVSGKTYSKPSGNRKVTDMIYVSDELESEE